MVEKVLGSFGGSAVHHQRPDACAGIFIAPREVRNCSERVSQAQAVVVVSHMVALVIAPPGSSIDGMDKLKGHSVGVIGAEANSRLVDVLSKEYAWSAPRRSRTSRW